MNHEECGWVLTSYLCETTSKLLGHLSRRSGTQSTWTPCLRRHLQEVHTASADPYHVSARNRRVHARTPHGTTSRIVGYPCTRELGSRTRWKAAVTECSRTSFFRVSLGGTVAFDCSVAVKHLLVCGKTELGHQQGTDVNLSGWCWGRIRISSWVMFFFAAPTPRKGLEAQLPVVFRSSGCHARAERLTDKRLCVPTCGLC